MGLLDPTSIYRTRIRPGLAGLVRDVRHALRSFRKSPGFTAVALLTLALGIGANTALFSVVNAVLLKPLPVAEPHRVVQIWDRFPGEGGFAADFDDVPVSYPNFQDYAAQNRTLGEMASIQRGAFWLAEAPGAPRVLTFAVSADFFPLFDVRPTLGRSFTAEEYASRDRTVAMVSDGFWRTRLGGDPDAVGREIRIANWWGGEMGWKTIPFTVVGVLPAEMELPPYLYMGRFRSGDPDIVLPRSWGWSWPQQNRGMYALSVLARLRDGVTVEQARDDLGGIAVGIAEANPESHAGYSVDVTPLPEVFEDAYGRAFLLLLATVGIVLLIACVNVANLFLARATVRGRELAVRAALGAGRRRLFGLLLTESGILALAGGLLGLGLAMAGTRLLLGHFPGEIARLDGVGVDARVLAFTFGVSVLAALLFGLAPALRAGRTDVASTLREGTRGGGGGRSRLLPALVVAEVALALVLLTGAGLLARSFHRLTRVDPGFEAESVLTLGVSLLPPALTSFAGPGEAAAFHDDVLRRLRSLPGVVSAAGARSAPFAGRPNHMEITIPGREVPAAGEHPSIDHRWITPGYFRTLGIPILRGRAPEEADRPRERRRGVPGVAVIDETMARRYWPGEDPLGKRFYWGVQDLESGEWDPRYPRDVSFTVVGVARDARVTTLDAPPQPTVYSPWGHGERAGDVTYLLRTTADPGELAPAARAEVRAAGGEEPRVTGVAAMEEHIAGTVAEPRFHALLVGSFAGLAFLLALVGLYGVLSYLVGRRTREMGIRVAMGARREDILTLVTGQGLRLVLLGIVLGLAGALAAGRLLEGFLFEIPATDPVTLGVVSALVLGVAGVACWIPARRATRVDPVELLTVE